MGFSTSPAAGKNSDRVFNDYVYFVNAVRNELIDTEIIYLPIKPSLARWANWGEMDSANKKIQIFCDRDESLYYVDLATPMLTNEGRPDSTLFVEDGLHLNSAGYRLWSDILFPVLEKIYSD